MAWNDEAQQRMSQLSNNVANNTDVQLLLTVLNQSPAHLTNNQQSRIIELLEKCIVCTLPKVV